jgi:hypothetical protein
VLRRSEQTRFSSASDDEVGGSKARDARAALTLVSNYICLPGKWSITTKIPPGYRVVWYRFPEIDSEEEDRCRSCTFP